MTKPDKIVIISGGIIGLVTAYVARQKNPATEIIILERKPGPGMVTSSRHAGHLTPFEGASTMIEAPAKKLTHHWNEGGWLLTDLYPVKKFTSHDQRWCECYLKHAALRGTEKRKSTELVSRFCAYSLEQWQSFMSRYPDIEKESNFKNEMLRLYSPESTINALARDIALFDNINCVATPVPLIEKKAARVAAKYESELSKQLLMQNIVAYEQVGCSVDTYSFCQELANMLINSSNIRIEFNTEVTDINISENCITSLSARNLANWTNVSISGGDTTQFIFSPGFSTDLFPEHKFKRPPVTSISGVSITLFPEDQSKVPDKAIKYVTHDKGIIVSSVVYSTKKDKKGVRFGGGMWFTGTAEDTTNQLTLEHEAVQSEIEYLFNTANRLFPDTFSPSQNKNKKICHRPASPDFMPIIDHLYLADNVLIKNGIYSGGQFFNGSSSCFASAEVAVALATGSRLGLGKANNNGCYLSHEEVATLNMERFDLC